MTTNSREYMQKWRKEHSYRTRELDRRAQKRYREKPENAEKHAKWARKYREKYPERERIHHLISRNPRLYPLGSECVFCASTENLEHAHLDYEDKGF